MTSLFRAAKNPGRQFLTPAQAELVTASLTRQTEDAIADEMAQDYQARRHDHAISAHAATNSTNSPNPRHPHRGRYYRIVQRNNNRSFHAGVQGRLSQKSVALLLTLYRHQCLKCRVAQNITLDHVIPLVKGGRGDITNIQPLCYACNNTKAEQVADYRPRPTLPLVYAIYTLYHLDKLTHSLRQHYRRALYRFDRHHAIYGFHKPARPDHHATADPTCPGSTTMPGAGSGSGSFYHFDTTPPPPSADPPPAPAITDSN